MAHFHSTILGFDSQLPSLALVNICANYATVTVYITNTTLCLTQATGKQLTPIIQITTIICVVFVIEKLLLVRISL